MRYSNNKLNDCHGLLFFLTCHSRFNKEKERKLVSPWSDSLDLRSKATIVFFLNLRVQNTECKWYEWTSTLIAPILSFSYPINCITEKLGLCEQYFSKRKVCEQYLLEVRKSSFTSPRSQPDQYDADVYIHTSSLFVDVVKF